MANYDNATQQFIQDIYKDAPSKKDRRGESQAIRRATERVQKKPIATAKSIAKEIGLPEQSSPMAKVKTVASIASSLATKKNIPAMTARQLTREILEKEAAEIDEKLKFLPLTVYNKLTGDWDKQWLDWEPETLRELIPERMFELNHEDAYQTMFALQTIAKTDFPMEMWNVFENVGHALNGNNVMINHVTPLEPHECALTMKVITIIRPKLEGLEEISAYIAACAMEAGMVVLPPKYFRSDAQEHLDKLNMNKDVAAEVLEALRTGKTQNDEVIETQIAKIQDIDNYVKMNLGEIDG